MMVRCRTQYIREWCLFSDTGGCIRTLWPFQQIAKYEINNEKSQQQVWLAACPPFLRELLASNQFFWMLYVVVTASVLRIFCVHKLRYDLDHYSRERQ